MSRYLPMNKRSEVTNKLISKEDGHLPPAWAIAALIAAGFTTAGLSVIERLASGKTFNHVGYLEDKLNEADGGKTAEGETFYCSQFINGRVTAVLSQQDGDIHINVNDSTSPGRPMVKYRLSSNGTPIQVEAGTLYEGSPFNAQTIDPESEIDVQALLGDSTPTEFTHDVMTRVHYQIQGEGLDLFKPRCFRSAPYTPPIPEEDAVEKTSTIGPMRLYGRSGEIIELPQSPDRYINQLSEGAIRQILDNIYDPETDGEISLALRNMENLPLDEDQINELNFRRGKLEARYQILVEERETAERIACERKRNGTAVTRLNMRAEEEDKCDAIIGPKTPLSKMDEGTEPTAYEPPIGAKNVVINDTPAWLLPNGDFVDKDGNPL